MSAILATATGDRTLAQLSEKILGRLNEILPHRPTEADFRRVIDPLLDEFCAGMSLTTLPFQAGRLITRRPLADGDWHHSPQE